MLTDIGRISLAPALLLAAYSAAAGALGGKLVRSEIVEGEQARP